MRPPAPLLLAGLLLLACSDSGPTEPSGEGSVIVTVQTLGGDPDLDGYELNVDDRVRIPIAPAGKQTIRLREGSHRIGLEGVAGNCLASGNGEARVQLAAGDEASVSFQVDCSTTGVTVSVQTAGLDPDANGYTILVDGVAHGTVAASASRAVTRLEPGERTIALGDLAANCTMDGSPTRTVTVATRTIVPANFAVSCVASTGVVRVRVETTGEDPDDAYQAGVLGTGLTAAIANGQGFLLQVPGGSRTITLHSIASNCTATGGDTQNVTVGTGGQVRDTVEVTFAVTCVLNSGQLTVSVPTTGVNLDDAYRIYVENDDTGELEADLPVLINGSVVLRLAPGAYRVELFDRKANCLTESPVLVNMAVGDTQELEMPVTCHPDPVVRVTTNVSGPLPATPFSARMHGYSYWGYGLPPQDLGSVPVNGSLAATVNPDICWYACYIELLDVPENCSVSGGPYTNWFYPAYDEEREFTFAVQCS